MRYWVYINDKVDGPYDETKLVTLNGFSQNTLICSEEVAANGGQDWVKASSIFEFDEVPVEEVTAPQPSVQQTSATDAHLLLAKLDSLTEELSGLHQKLDSMQTHLDEALEQNKQLSDQLSAQEAILRDYEAAKSAAIPNPVTQAPAQNESKPEEEPAPQEEPVQEEKPAHKAENLFADQAAPKEEELIIRSALDSIYGEKVISPDTNATETFQDLLPEKEMEKVEQIEKELTFFPVEDQSAEDQPAEDKPEVTPVKEALITTPCAQEAARDELINELTASPKEDILDQIIQEHQAQEQKEAAPGNEPETIDLPKEEEDSSVATAAAVGLAAATAAGIALAAGKEEPEPQHPAADLTPAPAHTDEGPVLSPEDFQPQADQSDKPVVAEEEIKIEDFADQPLEQTPAAFSIATDKEDPAHVEEVLPADQMPPDVPSTTQAEPAKEEQPKPLLASLDSLDFLTSQDSAAEQTAEAPQEITATAEELVPGKSLTENGLLSEEPAAQESEEPAAQESAAPVLTEKDLQDAFGPQEESSSTEVPENRNPNDLTEIELKEGSTYLISDFVPPAQFADGSQEFTITPGFENSVVNKKQETIIQDMLAVTNKTEQTQTLPTEGLPDDVVANKVILENTIQAKRGASLDIKTVPMVPEPADAQRLDVNELDDVNAQHDMTSRKSTRGLAKMIFGALVGLLMLIIVYVALVLFNILPDSLNLFTKADQATAQITSDELLRENTPVRTQQEEESVPPSAAQEALRKVQNFPLPNGMTLKKFIEFKHNATSSDLITWESATAVEPDNYSIIVKVPPENPQSFKTVYRFNYNTKSGLLDATISDAKNLLDQAYKK